MKLKVEHITQFEYDKPVYETATEVRLKPADRSISPQQCESFSLEVEPAAPVYSYTDYFGNQVHYFSVLQSHNQLSITARSIVDTGPGTQPATEHELINMYEFAAPSPYITFSPALIAFAARFPVEAADGDARALALKVCQTIFEEFQYEKGVTDVNSTVDIVLDLRRGVCQDFAHLMIAVCRCLDLPARYVSGYVYTGGPDGAARDGASHAWCEVYCGPDNGWIGFDPTHRTTWVNENYVKIGTGRDYTDVTPVRGTYRGRAAENLKVIVRVGPAD